MELQTTGIHHITAIVRHPQENVDFYAGVLGLRLVKRTVNFDDPNTYHLYFGDENGAPGTIITFFPWVNAYKGEIGDGQVGVTTYVVGEGALPFWEERLKTKGIKTKKVTRFEETFLQFEDVHGLQLEIVARGEGKQNNWEFDGITTDVAIKGFGGAVLYTTDVEATAETLTAVMGLEKVAENEEFLRFKSSGEIGNIIDVRKMSTGLGVMGVGTVHHIAWRTKDDAEQLKWQEHVQKHGHHVTEVRDRNYFNAIYFREHGKVLFEIATDPPGFAHDESSASMGEKLMLPAQYEEDRQAIEKDLPKIEVRKV
ncbi:MAG TPA: ring-cleaving dioxygenase [Pseudogracilibacillus sp.]|nr:ring-cleaving dioxygenase [Pseudogracilibacillus sp.]